MKVQSSNEYMHALVRGPKMVSNEGLLRQRCQGRERVEDDGLAEKKLPREDEDTDDAPQTSCASKPKLSTAATAPGLSAALTITDAWAINADNARWQTFQMLCHVKTLWLLPKLGYGRV